MKRFLFFIFILCAVAFAQVPGTWHTFADVHFAHCIEAHFGKIFVGTDGGVILYDPSDESQRILTNLDGLGDLVVTGLIEHDGKLYYSGANGAIGRLAGDRFDTNSDLVRSNIPVNDIISVGDNLYVATGDGVSKLNVLDGDDPVEIAENYTKLGDYERNIPVAAISADDSIIWAATEDGLAWGRLSGALFVPEEWRNMTTARPVTAVFADSGGVWFSMERESGQPSVFWTDGTTIDTVADPYMDYRIIDDFFYFDGDFYASGGSGLFIMRGPNNFDPIRLDEHWAIHGEASIDGVLYLGMEVGFGVLIDDTVRAIHPNSPRGDGFTDIAFGPDGDTWIVSRKNGIVHYDDGEWTSYTDWTIEADDSVMELVESAIGGASAITVDRTGAVWVGTNSGGVLRRDSDGSWQVFNETNSVLRGISGYPSIVVCRAIAYDKYRDVVWVTNFASTNALVVAAFDINGTLDSPLVSYYSGIDGLPVNNAHGIAIGENRIWLVIKDEGVVEIDLGYSLADRSDDYIRTYTDSLPSSSAYRVDVDADGRAWVAADGGVAVIDPVFGLVSGQSLPAHVSLGVADVDVDAWNNTWIATDDGAAMFRSSDSTWHAIKSRYSENADADESSDLATDYLYSVEANPANGDVWFLGEGAIGVFSTGFGDPDEAISDLGAYPNPYIVDGSAACVATITGVPPDADLHIYSPDGSLIRTIASESKGPSAAVEWDGRNESNKPVTSGVYILVAPSSKGIARGKIALVRADR